jgi:hypothetical protein
MSKVTQNYRWFIRGIFPAILRPISKALGKIWVGTTSAAL